MQVYIVVVCRSVKNNIFFFFCESHKTNQSVYYYYSMFVYKMDDDKLENSTNIIIMDAFVIFSHVFSARMRLIKGPRSPSKRLHFTSDPIYIYTYGYLFTRSFDSRQSTMIVTIRFFFGCQLSRALSLAII